MEINNHPEDLYQINSTHKSSIEKYFHLLFSNPSQIKISLASNHQDNLFIHKDDKPYMCNHPGCQFKYSQISNLLRHKRIHRVPKKYSCHLCKKSFNSSTILKQHLDLHKSQFKRSKFACFIDKCTKSYLYVCTLKKHLQAVHTKEYDQIFSVYGDEINFINIYKDILKNPGRLPFIEIKNSRCPSSEVGSEFEDNESSSLKDTFSSQDVGQIKEEVTKYLSNSMDSLKQYFDLLSNQFMQRSLQSNVGNYIFMNPNVVPTYKDLLSHINTPEFQQSNLQLTLNFFNNNSYEQDKVNSSQVNSSIFVNMIGDKYPR